MYIQGPSGVPTDFEVQPTSPTTIYLTWQPPLPDQQNGLIIGYIIVIAEANSGNDSQLSSNTTYLEIHFLKPFSNYSCSVSAQTVIGTGPKTVDIQVQTLQAGKFILS